MTAPQRFIFLLPLFVLVISLSFSDLPKELFLLNYGIMLATSLIGLSMYYAFPKFQRENWRDSVKYIEEVRDENHIVLFAFPDAFAPVIWYNNGLLNTYGAAVDFKVSDRSITELKNRIFGLNEVYYYSYLDDLTDPEGKIQDTIVNSGMELRSIKDFSGVGFVYKYEREIPK